MVPVDMTKLPYAYEAEVGREAHQIKYELHVLLCDLASKNPKIAFKSNDAHWDAEAGARLISGVLVFNNNEKIGKLWLSFEHMEGKLTTIYIIDSPRIQQQRGKRDRKKTKHYKIALKVALDAFKEFPTNEVAVKILENANYRMGNILGNATYQMKESIESVNGTACLLGYVADVLDSGPHPVPSEMMSKLKPNWRDTLSTYNIVRNIHYQYLSDNGLVVRLGNNGVMTVVDLTTKDVSMTTSSSYDLPVEYQEKLTILKIMDNNQAVDGMGMKFEESGVTYIYMTAGKIETTC